MYQKSPFDSFDITDDVKKREEYQRRLKDDTWEIKYDEDDDENLHADGKGLSDKYSADLKNLVKALLVRDPTKRLGYEKDSKEILLHEAFGILTKVQGEDGSPADKGVDFVFQKPKVFDFDQNFEK